MEYIEIDASTALTEIDAAKKYEQPENALALVKEIKKNGVDVAYNWTAKDLVNCLRTADQAYYHDGDGLTPAVRRNYIEVLTDSIYDQLTDILRERFPKNKYLEKVGAETPAKQTTHASQRMCKLPFPMASLDKLKAEKSEEADKWLKTLNKAVYSDKVDGASIGIVSDGKGNIDMYSRGTGTTGQKLSELLPFIKSLKKLSKSKKPFKIRGELVLPHNIFEQINREAQKNNKKTFANPRNLMAGMLNSGKVPAAIKDALFLGYAVIEPHLKPSQAFKFLESLGVETPNWGTISNPTSAKLSSILKERKDKASYDIDGLVISSDVVENPTNTNPKFSKAFKLTTESAKTKILEIDWEVSKTGSLIPTIIVEPVSLNGTTVKRATAHNAKYIYDNKLGKGAEIILIKGGEIIPYISEIVKPAKKADMPKIKAKWKGVHLVIDEDEKDDSILTALDQRNIKRITAFYRTLGAENVSEATFAKLYENGYNDVFKIAKITPKKLMEIEGFQTVSANKTADTIKQALANVPLYKAMYGSSCFDRILGSKRFKAILDEIPDYQKYKPAALQKNIASLEGFSDTTADAFITGLPAFEEFLIKLQKVANVEMPKKRAAGSGGNKLKDQVIVFTGFRDKDWSTIIEENGGKEGSSVSSKTTILVTKEPNSTSTKAQKARELGVKTMGRDEFEKYLKKLGLLK